MALESVIVAVIGSITAVVSAFIAYHAGARKTFQEQKQKAYSELLPVITRAIYEPTKDIQHEFNKALALLWLFADNETALKVDRALGTYHNRPSPDDKENKEKQAQLDKEYWSKLTRELQEAVAAMRKDVRRLHYVRRHLKPHEVSHIYSRFVEKAKPVARTEVEGGDCSATGREGQ